MSNLKRIEIVVEDGSSSKTIVVAAKNSGEALYSYLAAIDPFFSQYLRLSQIYLYT